MDELLIFSHTVDAFYNRALKGRITGRLRDEIRAAGINLDQPLLPAYLFDDWISTVEKTAAHLYPALSPAYAFYELGKIVVISYQETMIGKALFAALHLLSPRRIVERTARSFRTSNNFTEVKVRSIDDHTVELDFNIVEKYPTFTQAVLAVGLEAAGVKKAQVTVVTFEGRQATYRVSWGTG